MDFELHIIPVKPCKETLHGYFAFLEEFSDNANKTSWGVQCLRA